MPDRQKQPPDEARISLTIATAVTVLGLIVTLMLAVIGGIAGIYQTFLIPAARSELETKVDELKKQVLDETRQNETTQTSLREQIAKLDKIRSDLVEPSASPILLSPKNDEIVIGTYIVFQWEYKDQQLQILLLK